MQEPKVTGIGGIFFFSDKLKENGVTIIDSIVAYDGIGKFVHIMDTEDNKIQLWEPAD